MMLKIEIIPVNVNKILFLRLMGGGGIKFMIKQLILIKII